MINDRSTAAQSSPRQLLWVELRPSMNRPHAVWTTGAVGTKVLLQPRRAGAPCGDKSPTRGPGQAGYRCPFREHAYGQGRVERQGKGICQLQLRIWLPVPVQCVADLRPL